MNWEEFCRINNIGKKFFNISPVSLSPYLKCIGDEWRKNKTSLLLMGRAGRGKTYFSLCLTRFLVHLDEYNKVIWKRSKNIDDALMQEFSKFNSHSNVIKDLSTIKYLFLDDFGIERSSDTTIRNYYEIINHRWEDELTTVISTNCTEDELINFYGERIYSRLKDFTRVDFDGEDLRGL